MSVITPKSYQRDAVGNGLALFRHTESQLRLVTDEDSRRTASAFNGCVLLEAPTGAGKTLMAGMIAEALSGPGHPDNARVVWFWFTPFGNLVEQAKQALKADFPGLRMRELASGRVPYATQSGDVFVTTWASVAARKAESRRLRKSGDQSLALDDFIPDLRRAGYRIGVVVDEAHHGFSAQTEAVRFYREVMRPDFTLLITATPDDADIPAFKKAAGIGELHRIAVSRYDAVNAGLIKGGVTSVAYLAAEDQKSRADIPATALAEGWRVHNAIRAELERIGVAFMPLMLVQVGNSGKAGNSAIEEAREKLLALGVPDEAIASYTADEPNDDLLSVALDERKQVLIFKVAVAMGFDAPRAFTVVSLRGSRDTGFGLQVVGRILRVHRRLQPWVLNGALPELLRFGYVFLAEAESQTGLLNAGERINAIRTELSGISDFTLVTRIGEETRVQYSPDGQHSLLPQPYESPIPNGISTLPGRDPDTPPRSADSQNDLFGGMPPPARGDGEAGRVAPTGSALPVPGRRTYPLRPEAPQGFKTERSPLSTADLVGCVAATINLTPAALNVGLSKSVTITRKTLSNIFEQPEETVDTVQARLSLAAIQRRAQDVLFGAEHLSPAELQLALLERLRQEYRDHDLPETELEKARDLILATYPELLRQALRQCTARSKDVLDAAPLPTEMVVPDNTPRSRLNVYGVIPPDLNETERKFVTMLDADTSGVVLWWHRNEPKKPWSIRIVQANGVPYFPDFVIGVKDRHRHDGILLVETKGHHILHHEREKVLAEHKVYGSPIMVTLRENGKFMIVQYIPARDAVEEDRVFRIEGMARY